MSRVLVLGATGFLGWHVVTALHTVGHDVVPAPGRRDLDLALLPGEAINDDGLFMDSMSFDLLSAGVPMELRLSKDFIDALHVSAAA